VETDAKFLYNILYLLKRDTDLSDPESHYPPKKYPGLLDHHSLNRTINLENLQTKGLQKTPRLAESMLGCVLLTCIFYSAMNK